MPIDLKIGAALPGEQLLTELIRLQVAIRETMSQENRNEFDRILISMLRGWHNAWVDMGWPGTKV